jgi:hypothetical protein
MDSQIKRADFRIRPSLGGDELVYKWLDRRSWVVFAVVVLAADIAAALYIAVEGMRLIWLETIALVALTIWGLAVVLPRLMNSTVIRISAGGVVVRRGPLPWPRTFRVDLPGRRSANRIDEPGLGSRRFYGIVLRLAGGRTVWLVKSLPSFAAALRAKESLVSYLGLSADCEKCS